MDNHQQYDPCRVKEQHSQVFTLRSIDSCEQILELVPVYSRDSLCSEYKTGHWSAKEHIKYVMFLDYFADIFTVKHNIKLWKIFTIMSSFIKTRNSSQCRSHHQKTQRKHHSIQQILRLQRSKYRNYDNQYQKMKQVLAKLQIHNPLEIQVTAQPMVIMPSLKVLQEDINCTVVKKSVSLDNMNMHQRSLQKSQKTHKQHSSINHRIIHFPHNKYLPSQGSIDMDHQHDAHSQQRIKQLFYQEQIQFQYEKQKMNNCNWRFAEFQGDGCEKKDEKFDRTEDTIFNKGDGKNKTFKTNSHDRLKYDERLVVSQGRNQMRETGENQKVSTNLVRKKMTRTRSLLPFYDEHQSKTNNNNPSRFCRQSKINKLRNSNGKCKTLPPRRIFDENEQQESISIQKKHHHQPIIKSIFSGFVSEFSSVEKDINENYIDHEHLEEQSHDQYIRNDVGKEDQYQSDDVMMKAEDRQDDHPMIKPGYSQNKAKQNLLFCDYEAKVNQISDMEEQSNEQSFNFFQPKGKKKDQTARSPNEEEMKMNFTKKPTTPQIRKEQQQQEAIQQQNEINHFQFQSHPQLHSDHRTGFFHPPPLYHNPYIDHNHHQFHMPNYHHFYTPYLHSMQQYPYLHHNYRQFLQFYIYFLIHKIQTPPAYYEPS